MTCYLALDTATEACSVAAWLDGKVVERFEVAGREQTSRLLPMVRDVLAEIGRSAGQLDGIVCGVGPGSFSGVRIGVGVAKGLALARDLPVVGVSSLAMLAQGAIRARAAGQVLAAIDARIGEVYVAAFRNAGGLATPAGTETVCAPAAVPKAGPGAWAGIGTGWKAYEAALRKATGAELSLVDGDALPKAADALALALPEFAAGRAIDADALVPSYVRERVALTLEEQRAARAPRR